MTFSQLKAALAARPGSALHVMLPGGEFVPAHFHVTEVGRVVKDFIDCGGVRRSDTQCVLQVWVANDVDHRLTASGLSRILGFADDWFAVSDAPVGVEYDAGLVSVFPLGGVEVTPAGLLLSLGAGATQCLAPEKCGC